MKNKIILSILAFTLASVYNFADACSVCGADYTEEEVKAYTFITFLLILLPLGSFAFLGIWIGRKYLHYEDENNQN